MKNFITIFIAAFLMAGCASTGGTPTTQPVPATQSIEASQLKIVTQLVQLGTQTYLAKIKSASTRKATSVQLRTIADSVNTQVSQVPDSLSEAQILGYVSTAIANSTLDAQTKSEVGIALLGLEIVLNGSADPVLALSPSDAATLQVMKDFTNAAVTGVDNAVAATIASS